MAEHLTFILAGPFAGFGGPGGHERRVGDRLPRRSAIVGLLGAALGIGRNDRTGQRDLAAYCAAVQPLRRSSALRDYHTVETIPSGTAPPRTRRQALEQVVDGAETVVTLRDYRTDVAIAVAVWGGSRWPLDELAAALHRPVFTLSLGRRSCPPAWPLGPRVVEAKDPVAALDLVRPAVPASPPCGWDADRRGDVLCWGRIPGRQPLGSVELHSSPEDRTDWTFCPEPAWIYAADGEAKARSCT